MRLQSELVAQLEPFTQCRRWVVGLSGGVDSVVLLHALSAIPSQQRPSITAVHIHHGLSPNADAWADFCLSFCQKLSIECIVQRVTLSASANIEAQAREARFTAFEAIVGEGDLLLLAQHQDDQAETLLYRLIRGAGVKGLASMRRSRAIGEATLLRPLLPLGRDEIESYAVARHLDWVEDESNESDRFDRNFLRHHIIPSLKSRWPNATRQITQCAEHMAEADALLTELAQEDFERCQAGLPASIASVDAKASVLDVDAVLSLSVPRQKNVIRLCFSRLSNTPSAAQIADLQWQLGHAAEDAQPQWQFGVVSVYRSAGRLWFLPYQVRETEQLVKQKIPLREGVVALGGGVEVCIEKTQGQGIRCVEGLSIFLPSQATKFKPSWRQHSTKLKQLYQTREVLPAHRPFLPCVFLGDQCIAAVGVGVAKEYTVAAQSEGWLLKVTLNRCIYLCG